MDFFSGLLIQQIAIADLDSTKAMKRASTTHYHLVGATVHSLTCKQMSLLVELRQFEGRHSAAPMQDYLTEMCENLVGGPHPSPMAKGPQGITTWQRA